MRIAVIGAAGQLAGDLILALQQRDHEVVGWTRADLDITRPDATRDTLAGAAPDVVINTAAFHQVDRCESEPESAFAVNATAVLHLACSCAALDCALLHVSTDYVFNGDQHDRPYDETDAPDPQSVYAVSKLAGEQFVRHYAPRHFVVRTCGLFGTRGVGGRGGNFVETMLRLARDGRPLRVVDDQVVTPTATVDLADAIARLVESDRWGLYHLTASGHVSWHAFAAAIFERVGLAADLTPVTSAEYAAPATRPAWSVLGHTAAASVGIPELPHWSDALDRYLTARGHVT